MTNMDIRSMAKEKESSISEAGSVEATQSSRTSELVVRFHDATGVDSNQAHQMFQEEEGDEITQEELDAVYAQNMLELSAQERNEVLLDIHGVSDAMPETPEFVSQHRKELNEALQALVQRSRHKTAAYELALQQNPDYIQSEAFQLLFLRADRWNAVSAALRMVGFLEMKLDLFGQDCLTRSVAISDLSRDDRQSLTSGFFQLLPVRDVAGRAVMCGIPMLKNYKQPINLKRTFFYIVMTALEDEQTQKNGIVLVGYNIGPKRTVDVKAVFAVQGVKRYLPLRIGSIHYCYDDMKFRPMMTVAMLIMGVTNRIRLRGHYGSSKDARFKLLTFGIPEKALPLTADGEPKTKTHKSWLKLRNSQEESADLSSDSIATTVVIPSRFDVLLGRGKPFQEHVGNLRYHTLLENYQDLYERVKKFDKMKITQSIVDTVKGYGGRFLKQMGAGWITVDDTVARDKVAHAFRTRRTTSGGGSSPTDVSVADSSTGKRKGTESPMGAIPEDSDPKLVDFSLPPNIVGSAVATVTDTERGDGSSSDEDSADTSNRSPGGKRVKLWAASFHDVGNVAPVH